MIRIKWSTWAIMLWLCVTVSAGGAEFFKYRDQNGNIIYTDDITRVPRDQQSAIQKYQEYPSESGNIRPGEVKEEGPPASTGETGEGLPGIGSGQGASEKTRGEPLESAAETVRESPETKKVEGDLEEARTNLLKRKQALDEEYQALLEDKEVLNRKEVFRNKASAGIYNSKVADLNQRIEAYEKKKEAFNADIQAYNTRVRKEIEEQMEKTQEENKL